MSNHPNHTAGNLQAYPGAGQGYDQQSAYSKTTASSGSTTPTQPFHPDPSADFAHYYHPHEVIPGQYGHLHPAQRPLTPGNFGMHAAQPPWSPSPSTGNSSASFVAQPQDHLPMYHPLPGHHELFAQPLLASNPSHTATPTTLTHNLYQAHTTPYAQHLRAQANLQQGYVYQALEGGKEIDRFLAALQEEHPNIHSDQIASSTFSPGQIHTPGEPQAAYHPQYRAAANTRQVTAGMQLPLPGRPHYTSQQPQQQQYGLDDYGMPDSLLRHQQQQLFSPNSVQQQNVETPSRPLLQIRPAQNYAPERPVEGLQQSEETHRSPSPAGDNSQTTTKRYDCIMTGCTNNKGGGFGTPTDLAKHQANVHAAKRTKGRHTEEETHFRNVNGGHECRYCGRTFVRSNTARTHIQRDHREKLVTA